jgi:DNA polymerase-3 subunit alpha
MNVHHHLALRSDFSLGESMLQLKPMIERAKAAGYRSVALVDNMNISGMVEFTNQAKKASLKPIIGCTLRVYDDPTYRKEKGGAKQSREIRVKAYVQTDEGLHNLIRVLSRAYSEERFYYNARCGWSDLEELTGCALTTGDFLNVFHHPDAFDLLTLAKHKGIKFFCELVPFNTPLWDTLNEKAIAAALGLGLPTIISYPALYADSSDADTLDVRRAIADNGKMADRWVPKHYLRDLHVKPPVALVKATIAMGGRCSIPSAVMKDGLNNIAALADSVTYSFTKLAPCLPEMVAGGKPAEFAELKRMAVAGFKDRLMKPVLAYQPDRALLPRYVERLTYELSVLEKMGFAGYFLLVSEIVTWAKAHDIMVGPGRGSVGGSLVAYLIGLTEVDPIRFDLLFERFINPDRIDLPDADLDFMGRRRHEVIGYINDRFGTENVAGISNFSTLQAAGALRDVSRIHDLHPLDYACSKEMEKEHGVALSLEESAAKVPSVDKFRTERPVIWRHATKLEGCMRNLGQHAAGIVIADRPVTERAVVETRNGGRVVNWDKKYVEDWGLIKIDVLGLTTLDMLALGKQYVKAQAGLDIDYMRDVDLTDRKVMTAFEAADTTGRLPIRVGRHAQAAEGAGPRGRADVRGPGRGDRTVPPGPARRRHVRRVCGDQARCAHALLRAQEPRGSAARDPRRDHLPGTGDADRPRRRRVFDG